MEICFSVISFISYVDLVNSPVEIGQGVVLVGGGSLDYSMSASFVSELLLLYI